MATESSAVVRFISAAQKEGQPIQDSPDVPDLTDDLRPIRRSYRLHFLVLGVVVFSTLAAIAGVVAGKHFFGRSGKRAVAHPAAVQAAPAPAPAPVQSAPVQPAPVQAAAAHPAAPAVAPAVASTVPAAPAAPAGSAPVPPSGSLVAPVPAIAPEVLAETGFDIRVKPPAMISLDGRVLGRAPLRVRNLHPGSHVLDIEAPDGYFSRRVQLELDAGEPQNVNLALDPIDPPSADDDDRADRSDKRSVRRKARRAAPVRAAAAAVAKGTLMIGSKPPCDIYIDGRATGLKTPQRAIELSAGTHRVTLVHPDLAIKQSFTVEITAGQTTRAIHDLTGKL
jgi:hypothetical protein